MVQAAAVVSALGLAGTVAIPFANAASLDRAPVQHEMAAGQSYDSVAGGGLIAQRDNYTATDPAVIIAQRAAAAAAEAAAKTAAQAAATAAATKTTSGSTSYTPPAAASPNPGSAQAIALDMVTARGWGSDQYSCLVSLWNRESGWRVNAYNASSGAQGIPQALPGSKMASAGADWETNPATQITWGLNYISGVYGTPCGAWSHSENSGWY